MSIKLRLTIWYTTILIVALMLFNLFIYIAVKYSLESARLRDDYALAQTITRLLKEEGNALGKKFDLNDAALIGQLRGKDVVFRYIDTDGNNLIQIPQYQVFPKLPIPGKLIRYIIHRDENSLAVINMPYYIRGTRTGTVQVVERLGTLHEFLERMRFFIFIGTLLSVVISVVGGIVMAKKAFEPIKTVINDVQSINHEKLNRRLEHVSRDYEIESLVDTFNSLMDRLEISFNNQKRFVADASHELRTPLAAILGHVDLLSKWGKNDPVVLNESLGFIMSDAKKMEKIINDLLFLARYDVIEAPDMYRVELSSTAESAILESSILAGARTIDISTTHPIYVSADEEVVKRVIRELFSNAVKYTIEQGVINVRVYESDGWGIVSIADNGIGISKEDQPHIFERFFRADKARSRKLASSGLGLAIVKSLVENYGGQISVESVLGGGSTFSIHFRMI